MLNIDTFTNPYIPQSIVPKFPYFIRRWIGGHKTKKVPDYVLCLDIFIGTFLSLLTIEGTFMHSKVFLEHNAPLIVASYGASAILAFNVETAPLAQPRNILFGHFSSATVGVCLMKLFSLSQAGEDHYWIGGPISVGVASVLMSLLNCVHPPSGATALLPFIDEQIRSMGWWYIPLHLSSSLLMICVACVTDNILRSYPKYWWTSYIRPEEVDEEAGIVATTDMVITDKEVVVPPGLLLTEQEMELLESIKDKILS
jgi:CBS-domain-containing membrane protein